MRLPAPLPRRQALRHSAWALASLASLALLKGFIR